MLNYSFKDVISPIIYICINLTFMTESFFSTNACLTLCCSYCTPTPSSTHTSPPNSLSLLLFPTAASYILLLDKISLVLAAKPCLLSLCASTWHFVHPPFVCLLQTYNRPWDTWRFPCQIYSRTKTKSFFPFLLLFFEVKAIGNYSHAQNATVLVKPVLPVSTLPETCSNRAI